MFKEAFEYYFYYRNLENKKKIVLESLTRKIAFHSKIKKLPCYKLYLVVISIASAERKYINVTIEVTVKSLKEEHHLVLKQTK